MAQEKHREECEARAWLDSIDWDWYRRSEVLEMPGIVRRGKEARETLERNMLIQLKARNGNVDRPPQHKKRSPGRD